MAEKLKFTLIPMLPTNIAYGPGRALIPLMFGGRLRTCRWEPLGITPLPRMTFQAVRAFINWSANLPRDLRVAKVPLQTRFIRESFERKNILFRQSQTFL